MNPIYVIIPVAFIVLLMLIMIPISKKKAGQVGRDMAAIRDMKVHFSLLAGTLKSVNDQSADLIPSAGTYYGIDQEGTLNIAFTPAFTYGGTTYTGRSSMTISFDAVAGKTYELTVAPKEPKDDATVVDVSPVTTDKLIFKTTFYIITRDVTDTQNARMMRGQM